MPVGSLSVGFPGVLTQWKMMVRQYNTHLGFLVSAFGTQFPFLQNKHRKTRLYQLSVEVSVEVREWYECFIISTNPLAPSED